jgi:hypothetical protein
VQQQERCDRRKAVAARTGPSVSSGQVRRVPPRRGGRDCPGGVPEEGAGATRARPLVSDHRGDPGGLRRRMTAAPAGLNNSGQRQPPRRLRAESDAQREGQGDQHRGVGGERDSHGRHRGAGGVGPGRRPTRPASGVKVDAPRSSPTKAEPMISAFTQSADSSGSMSDTNPRTSPLPIQCWDRATALSAGLRVWTTTAVRGSGRGRCRAGRRRARGRRPRRRVGAGRGLPGAAVGRSPVRRGRD